MDRTLTFAPQRTDFNVRNLLTEVVNNPTIDLNQGFLGNVESNINNALNAIGTRKAWNIKDEKIINTIKDMQLQAARRQQPIEKLVAPQAWHQTPQFVKDFHGPTMKLAHEFSDYPTNLFWNPDSNKFSSIIGPEQRCREPWILIKTAENFYPLKRPIDTFNNLQKYVGGPSPLAAMLVGSGMGGLLGYGGGWLLSRLLPKRYFDKDRMPMAAGMIGAGLGAMPGLYQGMLQYRNLPTDPNKPPPPEGTRLPTFADKGLSWTNAGPLAPDSAIDDMYKSGAEIDPMFAAAQEKLAELDETGLLFGQTIPVDAFNQVVWSNARPQNPYGTKNPFGNNEQQLFVPPPVAALTTGLVSATSMLSGGSERVSPFEVGIAAAKTGLGGLLGGMVLGKTLGALAGLSPQGQETLQRTGLWGGILTGAVSKFLE